MAKKRTKKDNQQLILGAACGVGETYVIRVYGNTLIPFVSNYIPAPWANWSTLGNIITGGILALIGKSQKSGFLTGLGAVMCLGGIVNGISPAVSASARVRRPFNVRHKPKLRIANSARRQTIPRPTVKRTGGIVRGRPGLNGSDVRPEKASCDGNSAPSELPVIPSPAYSEYKTWETPTGINQLRSDRVSQANLTPTGITYGSPERPGRVHPTETYVDYGTRILA